MAMTSILQVLKLNDKREGVGKLSGKPYSMQDAECLILKDDGTVDSVGVLLIPSDLMGKVQPGTYIGEFALRPNKSKEGGRKIEAVLTGLVPYAVKGAKS